MELETAHLFAVMYVRDRATAQDWYTRLLGAEPSFFPNDKEAVWTVGDQRSVVVEELPEKAGQGTLTLFVDDLAAVLDTAGHEPDDVEQYDGVRKAIFRDPDGNEIGFGGAEQPVESPA